MNLFKEADLALLRSSKVDYRANINDERISEVRILRPQEIPIYVAEGLFDMGVTGMDWVAETGSVITSLGELEYSKNTTLPVRIVLAVPQDSSWNSTADLPSGVRVSTEYPKITAKFFADKNIEADIRLSYGATEAKVPDIVDCVVDLTETGSALRAAGLKVVDTIMTSKTELIANPESAKDKNKLLAMEQIKSLLWGVLEARGKVLLKMNVPSESLDKIIEILPSMKSPTVNELFGTNSYAVETVVSKDNVNILIPDLSGAGASDILEVPLSKIVH